jgi:hypothetical protein
MEGEGAGEMEVMADADHFAGVELVSWETVGGQAGSGGNED